MTPYDYEEKKCPLVTPNLLSNRAVTLTITKSPFVPIFAVLIFFGIYVLFPTQLYLPNM